MALDKVMMLNRHDPDNGVLGDCWRCCIATILGLAAEDVPNFVESDDWWEATAMWLAGRGKSLVLVAADPNQGWALCKGPGLFIASGKSPRGYFLHSVVFGAGGMVHDPHPSGAGIVDDPTTYEFIL